MIIYILLIGLGLFLAGRLIFRELQKDRQGSQVVPYVPSQNVLPSTASESEQSNEKIVLDARIESAEPVIAVVTEQVPIEGLQNDLDGRCRKLEQLLAEKSSELVQLKSVLQAERRHRLEFEKIKGFWESQVFEARQLNRQIKKDIEALVRKEEDIAKENSALQTELHYKTELVNKSELKIEELKNRIQALVSAGQIQNPKGEGNVQAANDIAELPIEQFHWRRNLPSS